MLNSQSLQTVYKQLVTFAAQDNFEDSIEQIFGSKIDRVKLSILRDRWLNDDFTTIPEIEILSGGELGTANGGYAASTNRIYLSASFLSTANSTAIANLLLEEIGHFIDTFINQQDTFGDEGAIFANFVQGNRLTTTELNLLRAEDDRGSIVLNGQQILIEQQNIRGDYNNNTLTGTSDSDLIEGLGGSDSLSGLGGNDTLNGGSENDTIVGGTGNDSIIFEYAQNDDVITDFVRGQDKVDLRNLRISDWETVKKLTTDDGQNNALITTFYNGVRSQLKIQGVNPNLLQATDFILNNLDVDDLINGSTFGDDRLFGGLGNDTVNGLSGNDILYGEQGNDILNAGGNNDLIVGGAGNDSIIFEYAQNDDVITDFVRGQDKVNLRNLRISDWETVKKIITDDGQNNAVITTFYNGVRSQLKIQGVNPNLLQATDFIFNNLVVDDLINGSTFGDEGLFGGAGNDSINGLGGNDTLYGEQGNDIFNGGSGNDTIHGGLGDDTAVYAGTRAQYQLTNNNGVFTVTDLVANRDGIDTLRDIQTVKFSDQTVIIAPVEATITLFVNSSSVNEDGTPNLVYTFTRTEPSTNPLTVKYTVSGTATLNTDYTQTGATSFSATTGTITFAANSATATLTIDAIADTIIEGNETLSLKLIADPTYLIGTSAIITGTITNDDVANQIGVSLSINDITVVEGKDANALLTVSLSSTSTQPISVNYTTTAINATANGDYTTTTGTLIIPANSSIATIRIPIVNDNLNEADESFIVTLSNPINATLDPDASIAEVTITDTLRSAITRILPANVENLTLTGAGATNGTGNAGNNIITGNIANNILNGGLGVDTLIGGMGNDTYVVDNIGDIVTETSTLTTEIDTVQSSVNYTLVLNVEQLTLTGTSAINGTGNEGNNFITGNSGANILSGAAGNDTLVGGLGSDVLIGGLGVDRFLFNNKTEGIDTINDFTAGEKIVISALGFGGGLVAGAINASQFLSVTTGAAATNTTQRVIYNSTTGGLYFDADGSAAGAAVQFATLATKPTLMATDFVVS